MKIKNKLLISYMLVVLLPVLLVGIILTNAIKEMALDAAVKEASDNVNRIYNKLNETFNTAIDISLQVQGDDNLEALLSASYTSVSDILDAYNHYKTFDSYLLLYSQLQDIKLYVYNLSILNSGYFIRITDDVYETSWYKNIYQKKGQISWQYIYDEQKDEYSLCVTGLLKNRYASSPLGVMLISLKNDYLNSIFENEPFDVMLIDDTGHVVAAKDRELTGKTVKETGLYDIAAASDGIYKMMYGNDLFQVIVRDIMPSVNNENFKIVSLFPIKEIEAKTAPASRLGFSIIGLSLAVALALIFIFSNTMSARIMAISKDMHRIAGGDFDFSPTLKGKDEIGQLSRDLGVLTKSIKTLIHEVYESNMQKSQLMAKQKEIKLQMLASQINPHFLFNTLETIRMQAHCSGEKEIARVVKLLGKIIRRNLEVGNELVKLSSEIEVVNDYLDIERFRYGDKIDYNINCQEGIADYMILPLLIQPVVENAIVHGLERKQGKGNIDVDILKEGGLLKIIIQDDGVGMDDDELNKVITALDKVDDMPGYRIGLRNVHQRIRLFYGDGYGIKIYSKSGNGTRVEIILPGNEVIPC